MFCPYRFHQGCAILRGPAKKERIQRIKTASEKPYRSKAVKNNVANKAKIKVQRRMWKSNNNNGKQALKSRKNNLTVLAESRQCAMGKVLKNL